MTRVNSSRAPLIGLVGGRNFGRSIAGNYAVLAERPVDIFYADYSQSVIAAGGVPVFIPIDADPVSIVERLDGLVMTGGKDIDPARYGQDPDPELGTLDPIRDGYELALLEAAGAAGLPTLGICRGIQIMNVHAGGTLFQHVPEHAFHDGPPSARVQDVHFEAGSVMERCYGSTVTVNSLHHQSVDLLGAGYRVTGRSDDGGIETIEHESLPAIAVQWHPEMLDSRLTDPVFKWLVSH